MRDSARGFHRETEIIRYLRLPVFDHAFLGHLVESVVEFDRLQARSVIGEHVLSPDLLGIKTSLPFLVTVAARPDVKHFRNITDYTDIGNWQSTVIHRAPCRASLLTSNQSFRKNGASRHQSLFQR